MRLNDSPGYLQARLNDGILKVGVNSANEVVESLPVDALFFDADEHAMMLIALKRAVRQHLLEDIAEISQDVGVGQNRNGFGLLGNGSWRGRVRRGEGR